MSNNDGTFQTFEELLESIDEDSLSVFDDEFYSNIANQIEDD